jgi:hypothetical protein
MATASSGQRSQEDGDRKGDHPPRPDLLHRIVGDRLQAETGETGGDGNGAGAEGRAIQETACVDSEHVWEVRISGRHVSRHGEWMTAARVCACAKLHTCTAR